VNIIIIAKFCFDRRNKRGKGLHMMAFAFTHLNILFNRDLRLWMWH